MNFKISNYISRLNRFGKLLSTVLSGKTRFNIHLPAQCEVLILDSASEYELALILLENFQWFSLDIRLAHRDGVIYCHPTIVVRALAYLLQGYSPLTCYMLAVITVTKPKAVIDFCSQSIIVDLARANPDITFMSIINGMFNYPFDHSLYAPMIHQSLGTKNVKSSGNYYIYCFGQRDVDIFSYFGVSESDMGIKVLAAGSLLSSYYTEHIELENYSDQINYDICLASQSGPGHVISDDPFTHILMECNDLLCEYLARFVKTHRLNLIIAPRTLEDDTKVEIEYNYFRKWFGNNVQIAHRKDIFSTYRVMRRSQLTISLCSTSGWEALAWKRKAMFCPFYLSKIFGEYAPGKFENNQEMWKWWLEEPDYEKFEAMLLDLINLSDNEYWLQAQSKAAYNVAHWGVPAYQAIRDDLRLAIGK
jgi:hypothetical protein